MNGRKTYEWVMCGQPIHENAVYIMSEMKIVAYQPDQNGVPDLTNPIMQEFHLVEVPYVEPCPVVPLKKVE